MHIGYVLLGSFPRINYLGSIILFKFATLNSINQFYDEKNQFQNDFRFGSLSYYSFELCFDLK